jgi:hypothetical protein
MNVSVRLFCVCVVLFVGSGLATGWSPVKGGLPTVYIFRNWKMGQGEGLWMDAWTNGRTDRGLKHWNSKNIYWFLNGAQWNKTSGTSDLYNLKYFQIYIITVQILNQREEMTFSW